MKSAGHAHKRVGYTVDTDESFKTARVEIDIPTVDKLISGGLTVAQGYKDSFAAIAGPSHKRSSSFWKQSYPPKPPTDRELERARDGRIFKNMKASDDEGLSFQFGNFGSLKELQNSKALRALVDLSIFDERFALENLHYAIIDPLEDAMDSLSKAHHLLVFVENEPKMEPEAAATPQQQGPPPPRRSDRPPTTVGHRPRSGHKKEGL